MPERKLARMPEYLNVLYVVAILYCGADRAWAAPPAPPSDLTARNAPGDDGTMIDLQWKLSPDDKADAKPRRVIRQALAVIAGRSRDHAALLFRVGELQQLIERAALLIGRRELQVLKLEPHLGPGDFRERARKPDRRALNLALEAISRLQDILIGHVFDVRRDVLWRVGAGV